MQQQEGVTAVGCSSGSGSSKTGDEPSPFPLESRVYRIEEGEEEAMGPSGGGGNLDSPSLTVT